MGSSGIMCKLTLLVHARGGILQPACHQLLHFFLLLFLISVGEEMHGV